AADRAGAAGPARNEPGQEQRADRPRALPVRGHGEDARAPAVPQAGRARPGAGGGARIPARARFLRCVERTRALRNAGPLFVCPDARDAGWTRPVRWYEAARVIRN